MLRFAPRFAVLGLTLSLAALPAIAQYPERPIRLVVPYAPGGEQTISLGCWPRNSAPV